MEIQVNKKNSDEATVYLAGSINEEAVIKLRLLADELGQFKVFEFNFEKVTGVNSLGVRAWVTFLRAVRINHPKIAFSRCTPEVISQINMIPSFSDGANIESFYTAYICPECEGTETLLIQSSSLPPGKLPKAINCPHCSAGLMETEELEDEYFAFILRNA